MKAHLKEKERSINYIKMHILASSDEILKKTQVNGKFHISIATIDEHEEVKLVIKGKYR